jgi:hypothetical protein
MKERLVKVVQRLAVKWPWRLLASRMLILKGMNRDVEAMNAAIAAMRAATLAADAATAAVNAAAAAMASRNTSSSAIHVASEPIRKWHEDFMAEQALPVCTRRWNRARLGGRIWISSRK